MAAKSEAEVSDLIQDILSLCSSERLFDYRQSAVALVIISIINNNLFNMGYLSSK